MRRLLWENAVKNLITANIAWPFIFLETVAYDLASRTAGHSGVVLDSVRIPTRGEATASAVTLVGTDAGIGAFVGALLGGFVGLAAGKPGAKWAVGKFGQEREWLVGVICVVVASTLLAFLFSANRIHPVRTALWIILGTVCWLLIWVVGGQTVEHAVGSESYYWFAGGAIIGLLTVCQGFAASALIQKNDLRRLAVVFLFPVLLGILVKILAQLRAGFYVAAGFGGFAGGAAAGAVVAALAGYFGDTGGFLEKAEIGAAFGSVLGLIAGVSGGASVEFAPAPLRSTGV
jgi:hypothetical protein